MMLNVITKDEKTPPVLPAMEQPCCCFSMSELSSATNNFNEKRCIGQGGFGKVYKGKISDGATNTYYAIKRLHFESQQGATEFWVEVKLLSRLRHCNIVPLIGYCNEGKEMALVYEYIQNGTLYDHLHKKRTLLSWSQWLKICIGAARGLDYLHTGTGTQHGVIHRDVKSSNILLDQNYAAKIADFGLAKIGPINQTHTHVSTRVKGTFGYMDPNYFYTGRLTRKSDVYAFGVVLVEVLSGRPALDKSLDEGLAIWAQDMIKQGKLTQLTSSSLRDHISKSSLKEFSRIAGRCLLSHPNQRPTMTEVVGSLDRALSFQEGNASSTQGGITIKKVWSLLLPKGHFELGIPRTAESKEINGSKVISENVRIPVPAIVTEVEVDQRAPLKGQDENHSKPNLVNTSYLNPPIDTSSSASTLDSTEALTEFTKIKESIWISNMDAGYSSCNSLYGSGGYARSEDGENNGLHTRNPASKSSNNAHDHIAAEQKEVFEPGVFIAPLDLGEGTNELKIGRFRRFDKHQVETWWSENREKVYERYNASIPLPTVVAKEVDVDQREPLEAQDENQSQSNLFKLSYLSSLIDTSSSAPTGKVTGLTGIEESILISHGDDGYSKSNSLNGRGGSRVELGSKYMSDHAASQEGENSGFNTRDTINDSNINASSQAEAECIEEYSIEVYRRGVYIHLLTLPDGTNELKRVRFSRRRFSENQAETWWSENREKVCERYNASMPVPSISIYCN
ncbi:putative protein kinase RLK-Pelle-CrRLK1L-1 family [Helianthus debilis subsp. tardiflorus]